MDLLMNALSWNTSQISECLVVQNGGVIQQLYCQLNVLRNMKQNTLGSVKPESGSLPQFNRGIFRGKR
ncbi:hypothetical protein [Pseudomonas carnis]|jgi:conjugal transfer/entry exclusion protein|uniref:Uncharacterized protein n=1 Tax=Pseudomonas carnis TaxID=2487355 RepID=A0ABT5RL93_9PSED|nr:hypothetical protein [Pseudomonas carnis]KTB55489.1 hypothetical protein AO066_11865 [Pseudomonas fluorescens]MDD1946764.1 hypothetical protein [Pseudomonas carnis]